MIDFIGFILTCACAYAATVFLAWYAYENDKMAPCMILLLSMGMSAIISAYLVYDIMTIFI